MEVRRFGRLILCLGVPLASLAFPSNADAAVQTWQVPRANGRIAFTVTSTRLEDIHVMNPDGTAREPLLTSQRQVERQPAWSATSTELLFSSGDAIWMAPADGSDRINMTFLDGDEERPRWSPDGSKFLFTHRSPDQTEDVWVMPVGGGSPLNLTPHPARDTQADWSPDGSTIAFTTNRLGNVDIFLMDADGTDPRPLVAKGGLQRHASWSPDGSRIVFDSTSGAGQTDIFVVMADGTGVTRLTFNEANDREPVWSPDGSNILFTSDRAGNDDVYVMDADGSDVVQLTNDPADERRPDWGSVRSVGVLDTSVAEGDGSSILRFDFGLSVPHDQAVTVDWATSDGSATAGQDYAPASGTATIPPGASSVEVSVVVLTDDLDEVDESVRVDLANASGAAISRATAEGTILDDDASPVLEVTDAGVAEAMAGSSATFGLSLSTASGRNVTVGYATEDGTALGGADYQVSQGSATIPPGALSTSVTVPVPDDQLDELEETFDLFLSDPQNAEVSDPRPTATITDDDEPPSVSLLDAGVAEGDTGATALSVPVELSAPSGRGVTVTYASSDGTATEGLDYDAATGTVTLAPGQTADVIEVPVLGDAVDEPDESFTVYLSAADAAGMADGSAAATIVDDDPEPVVSVADAATSEGSAAVVELSLSHASSADVWVDFATADGSATAPDDYGSVQGSVSIPAGDTRATISVSSQQDALDEFDEAFSLTITGGAAIGDGTGEISIADDDAAPSLAVGDTEVTEGDDSMTTASFPVSLSGSSGKQVTVEYRTSDGSATAGSDYASVSGSLTLPPGTTSATVSAAVAGDTVHESDETLTLLLPAATAAEVADGSATGTITNDDPPPQISIADGSAGESDAGVAFAVSMSAPSAVPVSVSYATSNGTAVAGADYRRTPGTLNLPAGQTSATITVRLLGDAVDEPDETFTTGLTSPKGATLDDGGATGTILDDDETPPPPPSDLQLSISDASLGESEAFMTFTVTLSASSTGQVSVSYATSNGTATAGKDYQRVMGTLKIPAGQTSGTITVMLLGDAIDEPDETFVVTLSEPTGATIAEGQATATILDDDPP